MRTLLLFLVISSILVTRLINSQVSLGLLGSGLLNPSYLQTGGLVFANADGSGPQAESLAAAIYGVAIPPSFGQFAASENFFARDNNLYNTNNFGDSGIHTNINHIFAQEGPSPYIPDFSLFGSASQPINQESHSSPSNNIQIDPIAARFGVVLPNDENHAYLFHSSPGGNGESTHRGIDNGAGDGRRDFLDSSPFETSHHFSAPSHTVLPDVAQATFQFSTDNASLGSESGLGRAVESPPVDSATTSTFSQKSDTEPGKSQVDIITTAFKFSDEETPNAEEMKRSFEQIPTERGSSEISDDFPPTETSSVKATVEVDNSQKVSVKPKSDPVQRHAPLPSKTKELRILSRGSVVSKSSSPYMYRQRNREHQQPKQHLASFNGDQPESLPKPEYLISQTGENGSSKPQQTATSYSHSTYGFLTAPGYRTKK